MDVRGRTCTLYPMSWEGSVVPPNRPITFDMTPAIQAFEGALVGKLRAAGLDVRMPAPGVADMPIVVRPKIVLVDPGRPGDITTLFSAEGNAALEVEGLVGDAQGPFGEFHAESLGRATLFASDPAKVMATAAKRAGSKAAKQILACLAAR